ncbi:MAG: hypothetical protein WDN75_18265 [Bacteroidota bacterium]
MKIGSGRACANTKFVTTEQDQLLPFKNESDHYYDQQTKYIDNTLKYYRAERYLGWGFFQLIQIITGVETSPPLGTTILTKYPIIRDKKQLLSFI